MQRYGVVVFEDNPLSTELAQKAGLQFVSLNLREEI